MKEGYINIYNQSLDYTRTVQRIGRNGIHYEYIMPKTASNNLTSFYEEAVDVKSRKSPTSKYNNGKKPGQYQPIGDKRYFTFYQLNKMTKKQKEDFMIENYMKEQLALFLCGLEEIGF